MAVGADLFTPSFRVVSVIVGGEECIAEMVVSVGMSSCGVVAYDDRLSLVGSLLVVEPVVVSGPLDGNGRPGDGVADLIDVGMGGEDRRIVGEDETPGGGGLQGLVVGGLQLWWQCRSRLVPQPVFAGGGNHCLSEGDPLGVFQRFHITGRGGISGWVDGGLGDACVACGVDGQLVGPSSDGFQIHREVVVGGGCEAHRWVPSMSVVGGVNLLAVSGVLNILNKVSSESMKCTPGSTFWNVIM